MAQQYQPALDLGIVQRAIGRVEQIDRGKQLPGGLEPGALGQHLGGVE